MRSFFFWLTVAASLGALVAQIFRLGLLEIAIVAIVANGIFYGRHRFKSKEQQPTAT